MEQSAYSPATRYYSAMEPCCADFGRLLDSDRRKPGFHIWRHVKEPPHYDPPRYFVLSCRTAEHDGCGVQICFCPFCGRDLNQFWSSQHSK
jgi:hypothetical protein